MPDYSRSKVYKLQCDDGHYYFGTSCNELRFRLSGHKRDSKRSPTSRVYSHITSIGWDRVQIVLVEEFPCENKLQLLRKENDYIQAHRDDPLCLNTLRTIYDHEACLQHKREAYHENRDLVRQKQKDYYEATKETVRERRNARARELYALRKKSD